MPAGSGGGRPLGSQNLPLQQAIVANFPLYVTHIAGPAPFIQDVDLMEVLGAALAADNPVISGIYDALGNRMPAMDAAARPGFMDVIDRAGRLVGIFYGDLGQINQVVPADALGPGNALSIAGFNFVYNGATWDMVREGTVAGSILVDVVPKGTILNGQVVTNAGVRAALAGATPITSVTTKALPTNTGFVYVGNAAVAAGNGYILSVNDSVSLDIDDLATLFIDVSVNGEGVSYIGIV